MWNSFGIPQGNFNLQSWVGKVGAARVKHEDRNGEINAKIAYFLNKDKQSKMPAWVEPGNKATVSSVPEYTETSAEVPW
jgi:hypothetical protein